MSTSVFVTGVTGYIGEWIVKQLIEKDYKVVGTVRSTEKGEKLKKQLNSKNFEYEVVAEIGAPDAFDEALKSHPEVTVFIHSASPLVSETTDAENDIMHPSINGVKNALAAIKAHGPQIKKVVLTSSIAAIISMEIFSNPDLVFTEESWSPWTWDTAKVNGFFGYLGAKTFAEKAAWDFIKTEKPIFTFNAIQPYFVIGPEAFDLEGRTKLKSTADRLNELINAGTDESKIETGAMAYIDVRDVAKAHIHAFESDVTNHRYVLSEDVATNKEMLDILNENFPELKGKIATGDSIAEACKAAKAAHGKVDNSKTKKLLGYESIPFKQTIIDAAKQILANK